MIWSPLAGGRLFTADDERARRVRDTLQAMVGVRIGPGWNGELRKRLPEWRQDAQRLLAHFRCDLAVAPRDDPAIAALTDELQRLSADFRLWWAASDAGDYSRGIRSILGADEPVRLDFQHEILTVDEHRHLRMVVYFPVGQLATAGADGHAR